MCVPCMENCSECSTPDMCTMCDTGYSLSSEGFCVACSSGCIAC